VNKTWRLLNLVQHISYLQARVPRIGCPNCGVKQVLAPWAREGSGLTLLFQAFIMAMAKEMPPNAIACIVNVHDTRIWRIIHHYVEQARSKQDYSKVTTIGEDEPPPRASHGL